MADLTATEGDTVLIDQETLNRGDVTDTQTIELQADNTKKDSITGVALDPDELKAGQLQWDTSGETTGKTYDLCVVTEDREDCITVEVQSATTIPSSVTHQYRAEDFASPWPDNVGSADMTVNGLSSSTFSNGETSVAGDGTDDYGTADGPETLPSNQSFGLAFTPAFQNVDDFDMFFGSFDGTAGIQVREAGGGSDPPDGGIEIRLDDDNGNKLQVQTDNAYDDGSARAVVINKSGNNAADIDIFVDDMSSPVATTTIADEAFDHTAFNLTRDMGFYARNNDGTIDFHMLLDIGIFEFNSDTYSQSGRDDFKTRRPEV